MKFIEIPENCPICGSPLIAERKYDTTVLICKNPNCQVKLEGRILHFVGANGLDIESISKKTVQKLINLGWITKLSDIFSLKDHREEWIAMDGFGETSVDKILDGIPSSTELWRIIASAGIPNVEKQTAIMLAEYFRTWEEFINAINNKYDFTILNGIGSITANDILNFDYTEIKEVMKHITIKKSIGGGKLEHMTFCITGKMSMKRDDIVKIIEENGGKFASVGKNLTYLICNDQSSTSSKMKKAADLGIKVITEEEFMNMLN